MDPHTMFDMDVDLTFDADYHLGLHVGRATTQANGFRSAIIGDVNGKFSAVFGQKLANMQKKQNFAFTIVAGNLFADPSSMTEDDKSQEQQLLNGEIEIPVTTYFTIGTRSLPGPVLKKLRNSDGELCPNLFVLGRKSSMKTTEGFKIVTIGGSYVDKHGDHNEQMPEEVDDYTAKYNADDLQDAETFQDCDILITSDWPADVRTGSRNEYEGRSPPGIRELGKLVTALKPRYHFSTSARFFEREPFFHIAEDPRPITRFVSIGPYGTVKSSGTGAEKWIAAYNLEPSAPPPPTLPEGATATPFARTLKRNLGSDTRGQQNGYRFSNGGGQPQDNRSYKNPRGRRGRGNRRHQEAPRECYFCLGLSANDDSLHMITSIAENAYTTIAKGPLTKHDTFPGLDHPYHLLIIPCPHHSTKRAFLAELGEAETKAIYHEMQRYRDGLHSLITSKAAKGADGESSLGAVTWEINRASGVHLHQQFLPMPVEMCTNGMIEAAFDVQAENNQYPKFAKTEAEKASVLEGDFFRAMIWSEQGEKEVVLPLDESFKFDLQFGRRVLAKLLGIEDRAHWKDVVQSLEEETADGLFYREAFKKFDFGHTDNQPENIKETDENGELSLGKMAVGNAEEAS